MTDTRRVAITGLGAVSALGVGVPAFWDGVLAGRSGVRRITSFDPASLNIQIAAEMAGFDPARHLPNQSLEMLDRFAQIALAASAEAWRDAGLALSDEEAYRAGVSIGTGMGAVSTQETQYQRLYGEGATRLHPFTVPKAMLSSASSQLGMALGLRGPTLSHSTACAAGSHAIGEAAEMIRSGRADIMIAGGSDASVTFGLMKAWEAMRVLAPGGADPATACRPFSRDRQGLVIGEGAGIVVLEEWERARARGAVVKGELAGYGSTADAGHITQPGVEAPARALRQALVQARLPPECIDYVSAHGTGTKINDPTETTILKRVFGEYARRVAVSSIKSMIGHTMGASGALGLIAAVLAIRDGVVPPTAHLREADPECDLDYVPNDARRRRVDRAVSNAFAFGGLNAVLAIVRV